MTIDMAITGEGADGERLSALADGEATAAELSELCVAWRDDVALRSRWRDYQLIGDVLRSEDLASDAAHDSAFLRSLRAKLEAEPVVLAPSLAVEAPAAPAEVAAVAGAYAGSRRAVAQRRRFVWPAAMAAGVLTAVTAGLVMNHPASAPPAGTLAVVTPQSSPAVLPVSLQQGQAGGEEPRAAEVANGRLIRDARIDRYLAAHQQWSGGSIGGNVATLRHVAADAPKR